MKTLWAHDFTFGTRVPELIQRAIDAMARAYEPYAPHQVGAAVLAASGAIYVGSSAKTDSFLGRHAPAAALALMLSAAERDPVAIAIVGKPNDHESWRLTSPCSECRREILAFISRTGREVHLVVPFMHPGSGAHGLRTVSSVRPIAYDAETGGHLFLTP